MYNFINDIIIRLIDRNDCWNEAIEDKLSCFAVMVQLYLDKVVVRLNADAIVAYDAHIVSENFTKEFR